MGGMNMQRYLVIRNPEQYTDESGVIRLPITTMPVSELGDFEKRNAAELLGYEWIGLFRGQEIEEAK
jgi:hypothetical protein